MAKGLKYNSSIIEIPKTYILQNEKGDKIINSVNKKNNLTSRKKIKSVQIITGDIEKPIILNEGDTTSGTDIETLLKIRQDEQIRQLLIDSNNKDESNQDENNQED